jgi:hypothetical protein
MISNVGNIKVDLKCGKVKVYQIIPEPGVRINPSDECIAGERMLEPGEGDQVHEEYKIDPRVKTVRVYTFFKNPEQPDVGWDLTSFYDLQEVHVGNPTPYTDATPIQH